MARRHVLAKVRPKQPFFSGRTSKIGSADMAEVLKLFLCRSHESDACSEFLLRGSTISMCSVVCLIKYSECNILS